MTLEPASTANTTTLMRIMIFSLSKLIAPERMGLRQQPSAAGGCRGSDKLLRLAPVVFGGAVGASRQFPQQAGGLSDVMLFASWGSRQRGTHQLFRQPVAGIVVGYAGLLDLNQSHIHACGV